MTDLKPMKNLLNVGEALVLLAIRDWRGAVPESSRSDRAGRGGSAGAEPHSLPEALGEAVGAFLDLLWQTDPFIVRFNPPATKGLTLFELQTIYVIGEWRAGNRNTVHEILAWWFPDTQIAHGRALLTEVSEVLDDLNVDFRASKWVHAHFLGLGSDKVRGGGGSKVPTGTRFAPPGVLWAAGAASRSIH